MSINVVAVGNSRASVDIMGVIGSEDANMMKFASDLKALGNVDEIDVNVASFGGSVPQGLAMHSHLKKHPAKINVHIDGLAFSMASYIPTAGDRVTMSSNGLMMIHNPRMPDNSTGGQANELRRRAESMDKAADIMAKGYAEKSGQSVEDIRKLMDEETWLTADEALEAGFIDEISGESQMVAEFESLPDDLRVPAHVSGQFYALFGMAEQPTRHEPVKEEVEPMATKPEEKTAPEPQGPVAATINELLGLSGADNDFAVAQLQKGATLVEAQNALNAILVERLQAKDQEIEEAKAAKPEVEPVAHHGIDGLATETPTASVAPEVMTDPKQAYRNAMDKMRAEAIASGDEWNAVAASQKLRREQPEMFEAMGVRPTGKYWEPQREKANA